MKLSSRSLVGPASALLLTAIAVAMIFGQRAVESAPAAIEQPDRRGGATTALQQPRYTIEAINFTARDETGIDATGSDEIVARFSYDGVTLYTGVYGSIDRGETHAFRARQRCIWPATDPDHTWNQSWTCDAAGRPGPVTFDVTLFESDGILRDLLTGGQFRGFCTKPSTDLGPTDCTDTEFESTVVGRYRLVYTEADLAKTLPKPGMHSTDTILIDNCSEAVTIRNEICGYSPLMPNYAAYRMSIRITRKPNARVPPVVR